MSDITPKATKRHQNIAKSKEQAVEDLHISIIRAENALSKYKSERKEKMKEISKEEKSAFKTETKKHITEEKERIHGMKLEYKEKKAALKAENRTEASKS